MSVYSRRIYFVLRERTTIHSVMNTFSFLSFLNNKSSFLTPEDLSIDLFILQLYPGLWEEQSILP